jgi:hypothetical protein
MQRPRLAGKMTNEYEKTLRLEGSRTAGKAVQEVDHGREGSGVEHRIPVWRREETLHGMRLVFSAERIGGLVHNVWCREADLRKCFITTA